MWVSATLNGPYSLPCPYPSLSLLLLSSKPRAPHPSRGVRTLSVCPLRPRDYTPHFCFTLHVCTLHTVGRVDVTKPLCAFCRCYNNTSPAFTQPSLICRNPVAVVCPRPEGFLFWVMQHLWAIRSIGVDSGNKSDVCSTLQHPTSQEVCCAITFIVASSAGLRVLSPRPLMFVNKQSCPP